MQTVLHGKHFAICEHRGDMGRGIEGAYLHDLRYLSTWQLRIDGERPQALGEPHGSHALLRTFARTRPERVGGGEAVLVERERLADHEILLERIRITNLTSERRTVHVALTARADFLDVFEVKRREFEQQRVDAGTVGGERDGSGDIVGTPRAAGPAVAVLDVADRRTTIAATQAFLVDAGAIGWTLELPARATWDCTIGATPEPGGMPGDAALDFDARSAAITAELARRSALAPVLDGADQHLTRSWRRSLDDLAALQVRVPGDDDPQSMLPAAGMPWFMTTFGRDTAITCLQSMLLGAGRARTALEYLARHQAAVDDPSADAEPGKVLHEIREGALAERGFGTYYGSIDSTPLWLVLLDEYHRWSGDDTLVQRLRPHALAALTWVRVHGVGEHGLLQYHKRSPAGLDNQSWRDSWDSQRASDGSFAEPPIAPLEAQGYAVDARRRCARLARTVWGDAQLASQLDDEAEQLVDRIDRMFWIEPDVSADDPRHGGMYAMALDGAGRAMDALTSNIGHLLWSGVVPAHRVDAIRRQLLDPVMHNGWGIRTMSTIDAPYHPLAYHNGTVWPHDTSLCIAGLARAGAWADADRLARMLLDATASFDGRLPELFAGLDRRTTVIPVEYPTSSSPQAWAAAAPILLLQTLLGLDVDVDACALITRRDDAPEWLDGLQLRQILVHGRPWDATVRDGRVQVAPSV